MTASTAARTDAVRVVSDGVWLAGALAVLLVTAVLASDRSVPGWEDDAFMAVNSRSVLPFAAVWPVMQLGNVAFAVVAAIVAALTRRVRLAVGLLAGGFAAYFLAKVVKAVVERPRPAALLEDVVVRGPEVSGEGFVSGHATVVTVVVALLLPYLGSRARAVAVVLALLVWTARVYVGAHLPLDVVGGAAVAVAVAAAVHLVLGRPTSTRDG
jgi:undecaprenyl-diphosphatase